VRKGEMDDRVQYKRGGLSGAELRAELVKFFASAADDEGARDDAEVAGIDLSEVLAAGPDQIKVDPLDPQFTGVETAILVTLLTPPVQSAWNDVVLPWLKRRHASPVGDQEEVAGEERDDED
jgi:hypothetical protein